MELRFISPWRPRLDLLEPADLVVISWLSHVAPGNLG